MARELVGTIVAGNAEFQTIVLANKVAMAGPAEVWDVSLAHLPNNH